MVKNGHFGLGHKRPSFVILGRICLIKDCRSGQTCNRRMQHVFVRGAGSDLTSAQRQAFTDKNVRRARDPAGAGWVSARNIKLTCALTWKFKMQLKVQLIALE